VAGTRKNAIRNFPPPPGWSDRDRLEAMVAAGQKVGAAIGEDVIASLSIAKRIGVQDGTAGDFLSALATAGLHKNGRDLKRALERSRVSSATPLRQSLNAIVLTDVRRFSADLGAIGWQLNEIRVFRLLSWQAFKHTLRESAQRKMH
jgi:hypothetical protein